MLSREFTVGYGLGTVQVPGTNGRDRATLRIMPMFDELETGPPHSFASWPDKEVPKLPGVYTIWKGDALIYVGMAGRGVAVAELNEEGQPVKKTRGLYGRLNTHANGK